LLEAARNHSNGLAIRTVQANLLDFRQHVAAPAELIVCMGDTLTHLDSNDEVERLCGDIAASLSPTGKFVASFRDYTTT
jgi:hypothetical protein